jgi:hypothetical protein
VSEYIAISAFVWSPPTHSDHTVAETNNSSANHSKYLKEFFGDWLEVSIGGFSVSSLTL